jgi:hypothetical protein
MSDRVRVSLANENVAYAGVVSFDGEVFEALGFADTTTYRMPIEPSDDESIALQELVAAIQGAIHGRGGA